MGRRSDHEAPPVRGARKRNLRSPTGGPRRSGASVERRGPLFSERAEEVAPAYATIEEFLAAVAAETAAAVILIRHLHRDLQPLRRDLYRSYRDLFPQWDLRRSFRQ